jgi:hypothetical protein
VLTTNDKIIYLYSNLKKFTFPNIYANSEMNSATINTNSAHSTGARIIAGEIFNINGMIKQPVIKRMTYGNTNKYNK